MKQTLIISAILLITAAILPAQTSPAPARIILSQQLQQNHCYVGEPLALTITWATHPPIGRFKAVDLRIPAMEESNFRIYDSHKKVDQPDKLSLGIPLSGTRAIAKVGKATIAGVPYSSLKIKKILIPTRPGKAELASATISCYLADKMVSGFTPRGKPQGSGNLYQYPLYFNNNFFERDISKRDIHLQTNSAPVELSVLPLPTNAPPLFSGLVGHYRITAKAKPDTIRLGDPLTLTLTISAKDYLEHVTPPKLSSQPGFTNSFRIIHDRHLTAISPDSISFAQTIRPLLNGPQKIPAITLCYFNPTTKKYEATASQPIPIAVKRAAIINSSIFGNSKQKQAKGHGRQKLIITALLTLGIALIVRKLMKRPAKPPQTKKHTDKNRAYRDFAAAIAALEATPPTDLRQHYAAINLAITSYLTTIIPDHTPGSITRANITNALQSAQADSWLINIAQSIFRTIDSARFAPLPPPPPAKTVAEVKDLIDELHNKT